MKGHEPPRPLTHDLLVSCVEAVGGDFQDVVISELKDHTYYAVLRDAALRANCTRSTQAPKRRHCGGRLLRPAAANLCLGRRVPNDVIGGEEL